MFYISILICPKFSLRSSILPLSSLRIFITSVSKFSSGRLIVFTLFRYFSGVLFFHLGHISLSPHFCFPSVFVCMCYLELLSGISRMALCSRCSLGPVAQTPWSSERGDPCVSFVWDFFAVLF